MFHRSLVLLTCILCLYAAYYQTVETRSLSVDQLHDKIINDSTLVILDVRTPEELTGPLGKLDDVINIPLQELESRLSELEKFRNQEIDVICKIGKRSAAATDFLLQNGFNAVNVLGGMVEYRTKIGNNNDSTE
ncbi:MAG: rhodanese-like domain-containing protein [Ignavibacteriaceae bacterium]|nr:rhodanese-like domain-containing protein [Ignavibacteriaceae bacterium]